MPTVHISILSPVHDYFWKKYKNKAKKQFLTKDDDPNDLAMHVQKVVNNRNINKCNLCGDFTDTSFLQCIECEYLCFKQDIDKSIYFFIKKYKGYNHRIIFYLEDY